MGGFSGPAPPRAGAAAPLSTGPWRPCDYLGSTLAPSPEGVASRDKEGRTPSPVWWDGPWAPCGFFSILSWCSFSFPLIQGVTGMDGQPGPKGNVVSVQGLPPGGCHQAGWEREEQGGAGPEPWPCMEPPPGSLFPPVRAGPAPRELARSLRGARC